MPRFKSKDGEPFEVSEDHARAVLRPQGKYIEVFEEVKVVEPEEPAYVAPVKIAKKKSSKKTGK